MYQVIDDPDDEELGPPPRFSVLPFLIGSVLLAIVFFGVWLMSPGPQTTPGRNVETLASRTAYLRALSEPEPALRRARLLDYQRTHPDTDREEAIVGQLDIINTTELADWEDLVQVVYDDRAHMDTKRAALDVYEARWNGRILGGRGEELIELRSLVEDTSPINTQPDRSLDPGESPISETIPSDILAGAPPRIAVTFPIEPPKPRPPVVIEAPKDVIVQPSVRRNRSPSYPRNAKRRNIDAVVVVAMDIDEKGHVDSVNVVEVQAERYVKDFKRAAERAAKRTRFNPKTVNGQAVPAMGVRKRYIFRSK